jgi:hypothetical protein
MENLTLWRIVADLVEFLNKCLQFLVEEGIRVNGAVASLRPCKTCKKRGKQRLKTKFNLLSFLGKKVVRKLLNKILPKN